MRIRGGNYRHEDQRRVLLASERALSTLMWVLRPSFLTHKSAAWPVQLLRFALGSVVSSRYPLCLGRSILRSKALVPGLSCRLTLIRRVFRFSVCLHKVIRLYAKGVSGHMTAPRSLNLVFILYGDIPFKCS